MDIAVHVASLQGEAFQCLVLRLVHLQSTSASQRGLIFSCVTRGTQTWPRPGFNLRQTLRMCICVCERDKVQPSL